MGDTENVGGIVVFAGCRAAERVAMGVLAHAPSERAIGIPLDQARTPAADTRPGRCVAVARRGIPLGGDELVGRPFRIPPDAARLGTSHIDNFLRPAGIGLHRLGPIPHGRLRIRRGEVRQAHPRNSCAILAQIDIPRVIDITIALTLNDRRSFKAELVRLKLPVAVDIRPGIGAGEFSWIEPLGGNGIKPQFGGFFLVTDNTRNRNRHQTVFGFVETQDGGGTPVIDQIGRSVALADMPVFERILLGEQTIAMPDERVAGNRFPRPVLKIHPGHPE